MADRMFDFNQLEDEAKAREEEAAGVKTSASWTLRTCTNGESDAAHPILTLADPTKKLPQHAVGVFLNPVRGTAFAWTDGKVEANVSGRDKDGQDLSLSILEIDRRFVALEQWLGENHVSLRLSGEHTEAGYAVYRMQAVSSDGTRIQTERDSFLQLVIERLLESRAPEEKSAEESAFDAEEREGKNPGLTPITDLNSMLNYLACAGQTLPENMRAWAERNVATIRSSTISPEERRHAERALQMVLNIQWKGDYFESIDPVKARAILDEELYGLERVKQRIMETIIQINRTHTLPSYGLLLAGPAGIGKSQLAYAVARILRLPWTSLDMSAIHDSEALTGSPRVYANAKPGRIMEAFSQSGASN
ncbi:MAG TPA: ATP-dependent Lon protease, partial [Oribacterium sp.]|nr:ATP-dependent Lon protease [Oribacterium sp.]